MEKLIGGDLKFKNMGDLPDFLKVDLWIDIIKLFIHSSFM